MRHRLMRAGLILVCGVAGGAGCSSSPSSPGGCTLIGCQDTFTASISSASGILPSGMHRIEVLADAATLSCLFRTPLERTAAGDEAQPTCPSGLSVMVVPASTSGAVVERLNVIGAPRQVHVWQYVDDVAILDAAAVPVYEEERPNGPECPPACRQASESWTLQ